MKKKFLALTVGLAMSVAMLAGCGKGEAADSTPTLESTPIGGNTETADAGSEAGSNTVDADTSSNSEENETVDYSGDAPLLSEAEAPEGYVYNDLSGLLIDASLENQRPIAVMVDNELTALDHFGLDQADVVYELMNSTANGRITRLMCLVKDWGNLTQFGSVRSARTVNCMLAAEWNAVLCHDGGPFYINDYIALDFVDHLNGVFSRVKNGKPTEFTEYICPGDLDKYLVNSSIDTEYNEYYTGDYFQFVESGSINWLDTSNEFAATGVIDLPFPHNASELHYNSETKLYEYYEYEGPHVDGVTGEVLTFTNVILQCTDYEEYDTNGYLYYDYFGKTGEGYYIYEGRAIPITWSKDTEFIDAIQYFDESGNPLILSAGRTYISFVPSDVWNQLSIN